MPQRPMMENKSQGICRRAKACFRNALTATTSAKMAATQNIGKQ